jgi:hypothetical protein
MKKRSKKAIVEILFGAIVLFSSVVGFQRVVSWLTKNLWVNIVCTSLFVVFLLVAGYYTTKR